MSEEENILFFNDRRLVQGNVRVTNNEEEIPSRSKFGSRNRINQVLAEARASVNNDDEDASAAPAPDWIRPSLKVPIVTYLLTYLLTHLLI